MPAANVGDVRLLEALPKNGSGRTVAVLAASVLGIVGAWQLSAHTSLFAVDSVEVRGAPERLAREIRAAAKDEVGGRSLLTVSGERLALALERTVPGVVSARVDRAFPHRLVIDVEAEVPVGMVRLPNGLMSIAPSGRLLPRFPARGVPELTLGDATVGGEAVTGAQFARVLALADALASTKLDIRLISETRSGLVAWTRGGIELRFGAEEALGRKLKIARAILHATPEVELRELRYVDVSSPEYPVSRLAAGDPKTLGTTGGAATVAPTYIADPATAIADLFLPGAK